MIDMQTKLAGVSFDSYIFNASGPRCSTLDELQGVADSESAAIMMKSCTIKPREGNPEPRYASFKHCSIQAMGLPNHGMRAYVEYAHSIKNHNKPIIASIVGFSVDEYVDLVNTFQTKDVSLIEINLSCPNIEGKPQVAYDFSQTEAVLRSVQKFGKIPLGLKLPPFLDRVLIEGMSDLINKYSISFISCINSVGNTLIIDPDTEAPVLKARCGFGGLSGKAIKPIALANVRAFYELLGDKVSIVGVGGVNSGTDAFEFLLAGASAVQVGTCYEEEGPACFKRLNNQLSEILERKGYSSVTEARGALKN
jgi:dihydroorotate dehydrogenase (fumarate)